MELNDLNSAVKLPSEESKFVNGQSIIIDGGDQFYDNLLKK